MASATLKIPIANMMQQIDELQDALDQTQADINIFFLVIMGILIFCKS